MIARVAASSESVFDPAKTCILPNLSWWARRSRPAASCCQIIIQEAVSGKNLSAISAPAAAMSPMIYLSRIRNPGPAYRTDTFVYGVLACIELPDPSPVVISVPYSTSKTFKLIHMYTLTGVASRSINFATLLSNIAAQCLLLSLSVSTLQCRDFFFAWSCKTSNLALGISIQYWVLPYLDWLLPLAARIWIVPRCSL